MLGMLILRIQLSFRKTFHNSTCIIICIYNSTSYNNRPTIFCHTRVLVASSRDLHIELDFIGLVKNK